MLHLAKKLTFYVTKHIIRNLENGRLLNIFQVCHIHSKYIFYVEENTAAFLGFIACNELHSPGKRSLQPNDSLFSLFMED